MRINWGDSSTVPEQWDILDLDTGEYLDGKIAWADDSLGEYHVFLLNEEGQNYVARDESGNPLDHAAGETLKGNIKIVSKATVPAMAARRVVECR